MSKDIRVAWRFLRKGGLSTALAAGTLGVAVAMCSVATGVLDETLWRPLPFQHAGTLITVLNARESAPRFRVLSYPDYMRVRDRLRPAVELAAFVRLFQTLGPGVPRRVQGELVSGNYFAVLRAKPAIGRLLTPEDDQIPSAHPVAVLSYELWKRQFHGDQGVVGRTVRLNRSDYTIVGVASAEFQSPAWPSEYWIPLMMAGDFFALDVLSRADIPILQTVGEVVPGLALAQARTRIGAIETSASAEGWTLMGLPGTQLRFWPGHREAVARFLGVFVGLAVCVLLLACANVTGLLVSRNGERQHDLAIRQALGATRMQLLRRVAAESFILTIVGAAVGLLLTAWAATVLNRLTVPAPIEVSLTLHVRLVLIAIGVSIAASLLITAFFAFSALRTDVNRVLARSLRTGAQRNRIQQTLVITQIAISTICLTAAALLLRTALAAHSTDPGFDPTNTVVGFVSLGHQGYTPETAAAFYERVQEELESTAEVSAAAVAWMEVMGRVRATGRFFVGAESVVEAPYNVIGHGYFRAVGIPVLAGREFNRADGFQREPVAIINASMAARFGGQALGEILRLPHEPSGRRIVGVVADAKHHGLTEPHQPYVYLPLSQVFRAEAWVHLRGKAVDHGAQLREVVDRIDPNVAVSDVHTVSERLAENLDVPRTSARWSAAIASVALLLAITGVFGILATSIDQRRRELSIRAALGATPRELVRLFTSEGVRLAGVGVAFGLLGSFAGSRVISALLYGVHPRDPLVFTVAAATILGFSALASVIASRRAAGCDPAAALKSS